MFNSVTGNSGAQIQAPQDRQSRRPDPDQLVDAIHQSNAVDLRLPVAIPQPLRFVVQDAAGCGHADRLHLVEERVVRSNPSAPAARRRGGRHTQCPGLLPLQLWPARPNDSQQALDHARHNCAGRIILSIRLVQERVAKGIFQRQQFGDDVVAEDTLWKKRYLKMC